MMRDFTRAAALGPAIIRAKMSHFSNCAEGKNFV